MAILPYVTATGNVEKAMQAIKAAATPSNVNQDFVKTILKIPGGLGNQMLSLLRKIGFVNADGTPSEIYKRFRNSGTSGGAAADALKVGYAPLTMKNEFWHALEDDQLRGLIIEETGQDADSQLVTYTLNTIKGLKKFAKFNATDEADKFQKTETNNAVAATPSPQFNPTPQVQNVGLRLGYTINLNLPATSDPAVFNAIFKSLKENLLKATPDED